MKSLHRRELSVDKTNWVDSGPNLGRNGVEGTADVQSYGRLSCWNLGESVCFYERAGSNGGNGETE